MKIIIVTVFTILLLISGVFANPRMIIEGDTFDFGFVPQKSQISHTFLLKSAGEDSLKILKVTPGCGCTKAPLEKSEIAPGDSAKLEIIFSTKTFKNQVVKSPRIATNEGPPAKRVTIKANVVTDSSETFPLIIKPFKVNFTRQAGTNSQEMTLHIANESEETLEIKLIDIPEDYITVELPGMIEPKSSVSFKVKLDEKELIKTFEKSITLEVNDKNRTRYTIPVLNKSAPLGNK